MVKDIKLIHQLVTSIKTAYIAKNKFARVKMNKKIYKILDFLQENGYILYYTKNQKDFKIHIYLKYDTQNAYLFQLKPLQRTGENKTVSYRKLVLLIKKYPLGIISTKKGLMFLMDAIKLQIGGTLLFEIKL